LATEYAFKVTYYPYIQGGNQACMEDFVQDSKKNVVAAGATFLLFSRMILTASVLTWISLS